MSIRSYGAKLDGMTDDLAAIQRNIDAAAAKGGGEVVIPAGTCLVKPTLTRFLTLKSGVRIVGDGRLLVRCGPFTHLFYALHASNVRVEGLAFVDEGERTDDTRIFAGLYGGNGHRFEGLTLLTRGTQALVSNGPALCDSSVTDCAITFAGGGDFDNSALYLHGSGVVAQGNRFFGRGRTAIELHGSGSVTGNTSDGYRVGMNLCSGDVSGPIAAGGNVLRGCNSGIQLWPITPMANVAITGNAIAVGGWTQANSQGIIAVPTDEATATMEALTIQGNTIMFAPTDRPMEGHLTGGILIKNKGGGCGVNLVGNTIHHSPGYGILIGEQGAAFDTVAITGNLIRNPGSNPAIEQWYRYAIGHYGASRIVLANNPVTDDAGRMTGEIWTQ
jgi:hypothetical protein